MLSQLLTASTLYFDWFYGTKGSTFMRTWPFQLYAKKKLCFWGHMRQPMRFGTYRIGVNPFRPMDHSGSVVGRLTRDRGPRVRASLASLALCPWARQINPSLVLVQPRKTCPHATERLLMGRKESNQTKSNDLSLKEFPTRHFRFKGNWVVFFTFVWNLNRTLCMQTVDTLIGRRALRRLICVCTICLCPTKRTLGLYVF